MDPIYTYCTIYEGDNVTDYDVKLDICCSANISDSLSQIITDTIYVPSPVAHETVTVLPLTTVLPTEDSNLTEGDVSTTTPYGDYSEATTTYLTTSTVTEVSTVFPDECPSSHSDTGYIVALVIITMIFLILLGYLTFKKISHLMQSQLKRVSCDIEDHEMTNKEENSNKYTGDQLSM